MGRGNLITHISTGYGTFEEGLQVFSFFSQMLNDYLKHYEKKHYETLFNIFLVTQEAFLFYT